jgi:hypothetical protein
MGFAKVILCPLLSCSASLPLPDFRSSPAVSPGTAAHKVLDRLRDSATMERGEGSWKKWEKDLLR